MGTWTRIGCVACGLGVVGCGPVIYEPEARIPTSAPERISATQEASGIYDYETAEIRFGSQQNRDLQEQARQARNPPRERVDVPPPPPPRR